MDSLQSPFWVLQISYWDEPSPPSSLILVTHFIIWLTDRSPSGPPFFPHTHPPPPPSSEKAMSYVRLLIYRNRKVIATNLSTWKTMSILPESRADIFVSSSSTYKHLLLMIFHKILLLLRMMAEPFLSVLLSTCWSDPPSPPSSCHTPPEFFCINKGLDKRLNHSYQKTWNLYRTNSNSLLWFHLLVVCAIFSNRINGIQMHEDFLEGSFCPDH